MKNVKAKHKKRKERRAARRRAGTALDAAKPKKRTASVDPAEDTAVVQGPQLMLPNRKTLHAKDVWADVDDALPIESLGDGLKLTKKGTVNFSEDLAREMLNPEKYKAFAPDRPFNKDWANHVLRAMQQGTFRWEQLQLILCSCEGVTYRMNGQHTSWARLYLENAPSNLPVQMLRYAAETEGDMRMLYASIDRGKARTKGNVIQSYLYDSEQFRGHSKSVLRRVSEGLSFWLWGINYSHHHSADELAFLMQTDYYGLALKVSQFVKSRVVGGGTKHMNRSPVMAALFETFNKNERQSIQFWAGVCTGADLPASDARLKLRNRLQEFAVNAGRGGGTYKATANGDDMYAWCLQAWNAWRKGKNVSAFRSFNSYKKRPRAE